MLNRYGLVDVDGLWEAEQSTGPTFKDKPHHPAELPEDGFHMYHATYQKHLPSIAEHGLSPKKRTGGNFSAGSYAGHSHGRVFVSRANRATNWMHKLGNSHDHEGPDHPDLTEQPKNEKEHEEYHSQHGHGPEEAKERWHDDHHDNTPVLTRYYGEQIHPKREKESPKEPHYRQDTEDKDDHYWENKHGHVHPDDIEVWHPHHKAWHPLDDDSIDEISQHHSKRIHQSLKDDPAGYGYDNNPDDRHLQGSLGHEDNQ
jgi:hypothetical protein